MNLSIRDYSAIQFAKAILSANPWSATPEEVSERAVEVANSLALRLAMGDPLEQAIKVAKDKHTQ